MAAIATRENYFEAAFALLSSRGYGALKLAPVCEHLGVTTGSFYHYFKNWRDFTAQFLDHWLARSTTQLVEFVQRLDSPIDQLDALLHFAVSLPHRAEAAIRVWSTVDAEVAAIQRAVDEQRRQVVLAAARQVFADDEEALRHAQWGTYLLVGYQQLDAGEGDTAPLEWALARLLDEFARRRERQRTTGRTAAPAAATEAKRRE
ncbi:TetR/AcrR family transcriptional regulator [Nocardia bovistercoris]|uniref:TetR/AcrR family transcriptional regulator n=1 Tax=Nocardia bovistercoris TaxID=2785916 RepID=A0A931IBC7_9NOCA|nr:TetR/AcrR family transcriptional regulator [Nocardia bovistercoris]MBH0776703.1 TetR/AcrR family transcriptional regulator [Nocardia bovistercoris]